MIMKELMIDQETVVGYYYPNKMGRIMLIALDIFAETFNKFIVAR